MPRSARDATGSPKPTSAETPANQALGLMVEALRLIDLSGEAGIAGAHLDLAIHRLREWIDRAEPK